MKSQLGRLFARANVAAGAGSAAFVMRRIRGRGSLVIVGLAVAMTVAACGGGSSSGSTEASSGATSEGSPAAGGGSASGGTLVFGQPTDPVVLDGILVTDKESTRVISQIFEGLVTLKPGGTEIEPLLATSWKPSTDGKTWTFKLREGVKFQDGTPFDASAVCYNFDRWYGFTGSFQNPSATLYWQTIFGGFKDTVGDKSAPEALQTSLYKSCETDGASTVRIHLTRPSASFLSAMVMPSFAFGSPKALKQYGANKGDVDSEGVFHPTGTYGTEHPVGTGPFKLESWNHGESLTLVPNDDYWGEAPKLNKLIFQFIGDNAARLQALQTGEIQGYDLVEPQDISTIEDDPNLEILDRPPFNVAYVGITQSHAPLDNLKVRQALAYALNKKRVVDSFYAGRGEVADEFLPPSMPGFAGDVQTYPYDPARAKQLLQEAGVKTPVELTFCYPTNIARDYMPDPKRNYEAFAADLEGAGFKITPRAAPWSPDFLGLAIEGKCPLYLLGLTPEFPTANAVFGVLFGSESKLFGFNNPALFDLLRRAESESQDERREQLYEQASRKLMELLPAIPYARTKPALAFRADVKGYVPSPIGLESFASVMVGDGA